MATIGQVTGFSNFLNTPGATANFGGGTVVRNPDGTATFTGPGGVPATLDANTTLSQLGAINPQVQQELVSRGLAPAPQAPAQAGPQIGVLGAEQALQSGLSAALSGLTEGLGQARTDIQAGQQQVGQTIGQGVSALQPFVAPGSQAINLQAALSGASGAAAQAQALADFQASPGQQFLQDRGEQALLRNQAAIGGLGGGRVRQELQQQGIGFANQAFGERFGQLGSLSGLGLQGAGQQAGLRGQQAGLETQLAGQLGELGRTGGLTAAQLAFQTGQDLASGRSRAGELLASQVGGTTSALANLAAQQGQGVSDIAGTAGGNLADILAGAGTTQAQGLQDLGVVLANIATGQGSQIAGLPSIPGTQQTRGILDALAQFSQGAGTAAAASDIRLKENIKRIADLGNGIYLYIWDWTDKAKTIVGDQINIGVIAQEIMEISPHAVIQGDDGYLRVKYGEILNG